MSPNLTVYAMAHAAERPHLLREAERLRLLDEAEAAPAPRRPFALLRRLGAAFAGRRRGETAILPLSGHRSVVEAGSATS